MSRKNSEKGAPLGGASPLEGMVNNTQKIEKPVPTTDFTRLQAVKSISVLGEHDGVLEDDILDLLED